MSRCRSGPSVCRAASSVPGRSRSSASISAGPPDTGVGSPTPIPRATVEALPARDQEILRLLALGRTNRQIGVELHLSHGTVRNRVGRILDKLGAADRTHAAVLALALGMLETE